LEVVDNLFGFVLDFQIHYACTTFFDVVFGFGGDVAWEVI
jgi:hypothetical protein